MTAVALVTGDSQYVLRGLWLVLTVCLTRGALLFLVVYGISRVFPWLPAAFRHSLWFVVICAFVLLPFARLLVPVVQLAPGISGGPGTVSALLTAPLVYVLGARRFAKFVISHGAKQLGKERADWLAGIMADQDRTLMVSAWRVFHPPKKPGTIGFPTDTYRSVTIRE